jgi:hypothetical protein
MALQIRIIDSTDYSRDVLFFSIHCDRMDEHIFLAMSEMLREEFEWPLRRNRTEIRVTDVFARLQAMFPNKVTHHTEKSTAVIDAYYIIRDMVVPTLIFTRTVHETRVWVNPYVEGAMRLHELYP